MSLPELLYVGEALDRRLLVSLGLYDSVKDAELEAHWRSKTAGALLGPLRIDLAFLSQYDNKLLSPSRGKARRAGGPPIGRRRVLPPAGTVIEVKHRFIGKRATRGTVVFRALVIDQNGYLLPLCLDRTPTIYRSPSGAAQALTRNRAEQGWSFFGVD